MIDFYDAILTPLIVNTVSAFVASSAFPALSNRRQRRVAVATPSYIGQILAGSASLRDELGKLGRRSRVCGRRTQRRTARPWCARNGRRTLPRASRA
jgi:hypothetical protein